MSMRRWTWMWLLSFAVSLPVCANKDSQLGQGADGAQAAASAKGDADVVAYVGDLAITRDEVGRRIAGRLMKIRQEEYEALREAVDEVVADRLLESEARARGIGVEELLRAEVDGKVEEPSGAEIDQLYQANKDRAPALRGKSLEEGRSVVVQAIRQQRWQQRRQAFIDELKAKASVRVLLEPPRVEVPLPEGEPARGPAGAPIVMVEFSDYQCPYCRRAEATVERVLREYGDKIRFVYRDYPLAFHPRALPAALAARCAGDQGKYWEFHAHLMQGTGDLSDQDLKQRAQQLGLDPVAFNACYDGRRHEATVQASFQQGSELGVTGTPTFFINGRMLVGAQPYEEFKQIIEEELQRARAGSGREEVGG